MYEIKRDDLSGHEIAALIGEHLQSMYLSSPPESVHALDLTKLKGEGIAFWSIWKDGDLAGCGALKELDAEHAEVKSMKTASAHLRKGVARSMLQHLIDEARQRGYRRLSLETGSMAVFDPARRLYESFGFQYCDPFADYTEDPNSVFMALEL